MQTGRLLEVELGVGGNCLHPHFKFSKVMNINYVL